MNLIHYSDKPRLTVGRIVKHMFNPRYVQEIDMKPRGFWVSDDSDYGWKEWCEGENFRLENLAYSHEVTLTRNANILRIGSVENLDLFTRTYDAGEHFNKSGIPIPKGMFSIGTFMDWPKIVKGYQGLIITPYLWKRRMDYLWYYGWDCASGCSIWDARCIARVVSRPTTAKPILFLEDKRAAA